jgi:hypothetical protein
MIENGTDIREAEKPAVRGTASDVHEGIDPALDSGVTTLSLVLMLVIGFRLEIRDEERAKQISNFIGNLITTTIADESMHGTTFTDVVRKSINELFGGLDEVNVDDKGITAHEDLCHFATRTNGGSIRKDGIRGNGFMATW